MVFPFSFRLPNLSAKLFFFTPPLVSCVRPFLLARFSALLSRKVFLLGNETDPSGI